MGKSGYCRYLLINYSYLFFLLSPFCLPPSQFFQKNLLSESFQNVPSCLSTPHSPLAHTTFTLADSSEWEVLPQPFLGCLLLIRQHLLGGTLTHLLSRVGLSMSVCLFFCFIVLLFSSPLYGTLYLKYLLLFFLVVFPTVMSTLGGWQRSHSSCSPFLS